VGGNVVDLRPIMYNCLAESVCYDIVFHALDRRKIYFERSATMPEFSQKVDTTGTKPVLENMYQSYRIY